VDSFASGRERRASARCIAQRSRRPQRGIEVGRREGSLVGQLGFWPGKTRIGEIDPLIIDRKDWAAVQELITEVQQAERMTQRYAVGIHIRNAAVHLFHVVERQQLYVPTPTASDLKVHEAFFACAFESGQLLRDNFRCCCLKLIEDFLVPCTNPRPGYSRQGRSSSPLRSNPKTGNCAIRVQQRGARQAFERALCALGSRK
jgi:hypothetical protein